MAPVVIGRVIRSRARLNEALREKTARLEDERAHRAEAAAVEERSRIAGELHDVVAHALSAMVVQASGARRLAERDPQRAADAFQAVETSGREALTEIRRLLGVLRRDDEELALAPQPSLRHVSSLVKRLEAAGLPVEVGIEGEQRDLPIGIDLTAYRVVQEALGGALEHGHAGHAEVKLRYGADHVELVVADDGNAPDRPLLGIRERVTLSGGQLRAGARRDGGHVVRARLPLGGAERDPQAPAAGPPLAGPRHRDGVPGRRPDRAVRARGCARAAERRDHGGRLLDAVLAPQPADRRRVP